MSEYVRSSLTHSTCQKTGTKHKYTYIYIYIHGFDREQFDYLSRVIIDTTTGAVITDKACLRDLQIEALPRSRMILGTTERNCTLLEHAFRICEETNLRSIHDRVELDEFCGKFLKQYKDYALVPLTAFVTVR